MNYNIFRVFVRGGCMLIMFLCAHTNEFQVPILSHALFQINNVHIYFIKLHAYNNDFVCVDILAQRGFVEI